MSPDRARVPEDEIVPERAAEQLLARASELDALHAAGVPVHALRAASLEAGISERAFDAAVGEMRRGVGDTYHVPRPRPRIRRWAIAVAAATVLAGGMVTVMQSRAREVAEAQAAVPMTDEAILLRCLPAGEAAELVRPILSLRSNSVLISPNAPRVLRLHATPEQMQKVHALLDRYEGGAASACTVPRTVKGTRT